MRVLPDYIPVYFQACKDATPILSGVYMLALCFTMGPFNILSSISVTITKRYRPQIWFAWAAMLIGIATFTIVRADTSLGTVLGLLVVIAIGTGVIYGSFILSFERMNLHVLICNGNTQL